MSFEDVIKYYGDEIEELGYGRKQLKEWLSSRLNQDVSEHYARKVLEALAITSAIRGPYMEDPEPEESIEDRLRSVYGITDPSWQPVSMWGEPHDPRAKWERRFDVASAERMKEIVDRVGGVVNQPLAYIEPDTSRERLAVLSIRDSHFGMFTDHADPYETYDLTEAQNAYLDAARSQLLLATTLQCERVVFPVGSDLLHVDGPENATTKGTPQEVSTAWWKAFEAGLRSVNQVVRMADGYGYKEMVLVLESGNHDHSMAQALGFALAERWGDHSLDMKVTVLAGPQTLKHVAFGGVRLFFHHGDTMKPESYQGIIMNDYRDVIADATYIEVLSGHLHHRRKSVLQAVGDYLESSGIVYRITPALAPATNWSESMGYRSVPGAQTTIYDSEGFVAMSEHRPRPVERSHLP